MPDRFEQGTPPFADLAGVAAAVDHLASFADASGGSRRERVVASMTAVAQYEEDLVAVMFAGLAAMPGVTAYGAARRRTATAYFNVAGHSPQQVAAHLAARRVNVWSGDNYAWELAGVLGRAGQRWRGPRGPGALQRPQRRGPAAGRGGRAGR